MNRAAEITLAPPLRGEWAILNPPGHAPLAYDFLATRGSRAPYPVKTFLRHLVATIDASEVYGWARPVISPVDGVVVTASDGAPDKIRLNMPRNLLGLLLKPPPPGSPFSAYGGNHVIIEADGRCVLLAHLQCGSLRVRAGDRVTVGDPLGRVGNSGSSLQPHLHLQVMSSADPFPLFRNLVAFDLGPVAKRKGGVWTVHDRAPLRNGDHLRL